LAWIAIGAALVSIPVLADELWRRSKTDNRYLYVSVSLVREDQERAIAAVGECTEQFVVSMPYDGFNIVVPLRQLNAADFVCLTEKLAPVRHSMSIEAKGASQV